MYPTSLDLILLFPFKNPHKFLKCRSVCHRFRFLTFRVFYVDQKPNGSKNNELWVRRCREDDWRRLVDDMEMVKHEEAQKQRKDVSYWPRKGSRTLCSRQMDLKQKKNDVFNFSLNFKYLKRLHATGRLEIGRSNLDISMSTFELRLTFEFLTFKVVHSCMWWLAFFCDNVEK